MTISNVYDIKDLNSDPDLFSLPRERVNGNYCPKIGGIVLLRNLGMGGMGKVYCGYKEAFRGEVAVKILPVKDSNDTEARERLFLEAQVAVRITSDHLVRVYDVGMEHNVNYIVMELIKGKSAEGYLKSLKTPELPPENVALEICLAVCKGLVLAHQKDVIHRDIKPDNILIPYAPDGATLKFDAAKLADLGLAKAFSGTFAKADFTVPGSAMGTPGYASPEQLQDAIKAHKPSDIFNMGATLYKLLTGSAPFTGTSAMNIMMATVSTAVSHKSIIQFRRDVSAQTTELVDRCLAKDANQRYKDAVELYDALLECQKACAFSGSGTGPGRVGSGIGSGGGSVRNVPGSGSGTVPPKTGERTVLEPDAGEFARVEDRKRTDRIATEMARKKQEQERLEREKAERERQIREAVEKEMARMESERVARELEAKQRAEKEASDRRRYEAIQKAENERKIREASSQKVAETLRKANWPSQLDLGGGVTLDLIPVQAARFNMGCDIDSFDNEKPVHSVILKGYCMGKVPVTVRQFRQFANSSGYPTDAEKEKQGFIWANGRLELTKNISWRNPGFAQTDDHPVVLISWNDAQEFLKWTLWQTGKPVRLPTEAEWECACRAGTSTRFYSGKEDRDLLLAGWFNDNSNSSTQPTGVKEPNKLGLYDLHGNVMEWCADRYEAKYYEIAPVENPQGPLVGGFRVLRGGSWLDTPDFCTSSYRVGDDPKTAANYIGLRIALTPNT